MPLEKQYHKRGKLLLTAEYFVLDSVPALAVPTKLGQLFFVHPIRPHQEHDFYWRAFDHENERWFSHAFELTEFAKAPPTVRSVADRFRQIMAAGESLRPGCTQRLRGYEVHSRLQFNRNWGLGSSSTLIAAIAQMLDVNAYELLERTFGGSGYDLACATAEGPLVYTRNGITPGIEALHWSPEWLGQTYFVYRNQKQNSREGIRAYREKTVTESVRREVGELTTALLDPALHLRAAARILRDHERLVSETIGLPPVQAELFADFPGQIKSLGAWGGDFIWALSEEPAEKVRGYFNEQGYSTVLDYNEMVL